MPRFTLYGAGANWINSFLDGSNCTSSSPGETNEASVPTIQHASEIPRNPHRPSDRRRAETDLFLDLVQQFEWIPSGPVVLVQKCKNRHGTCPTHLKQLERLSLDALRHIQNHDCCVCGSEHPIGIFGEITVTWRVEKVHYTVPVGELQCS